MVRNISLPDFFKCPADSRPRNQTKDKKIFKYYFVFAIIFILTISLLSYVFYHTHLEATSLSKEQFNEQQTYLVEQTANRIEENIILLIRELELISKMPAIKAVNIKESKKILKERFEYLRKLFVNDIAIIDLRGIVRLPLRSPQLTGSDISFREYFKNTSKMKKSTTAYDFITFKGIDEGEKGIVIAMPVFSGKDKMGGVILFTIKVSELIKGVIPQNYTRGKFWVIDSSGNILFHPKYTSLQAIDNLTNLDHSFMTFLALVKSERTATDEFISPQGVRTIAASYPIEIGAQSWSLVIDAPVREVSRLLKHFNRDLGIGASVAGVVITSTSFFVMFLVYRWNQHLESTLSRRTEELKLTEGEFRQLVETINDCIWKIDQNGAYIYVSPKIKDLLGYEPEEVLGKVFFDFMPPEEAKSVADFFNIITSSQRPFRLLEHTYLHKGGRPVIFESSGTPFYSPDGKLSGYQGVNRDITKRKKAEASLILFRNLIDQSNDAIFVAAPESGQVIDINNEACLSLNYAREELLSRKISDVELFLLDDYSWAKHIRNVRKRGTLILEGKHRCKDGSEFPVEINAKIVNVDDKDYIVAVVRDITERKKNEEKFFLYQDRLKTLSSELALSEERQRRKIAVDIHDRIGQALSISLSRLEYMKEQKSDRETSDTLERICNLLNQTIKDTRSLVFEISPPLLYDVGFEAAVDWLLEKVHKEHKIKTHFSHDRNPTLMSEDISGTLFQAVRELVLNVVKHSGGDNVTATIRKDKGNIHIEVIDDGAGFDTSILASYAAGIKGFGLFSIMERLRYLGGSFEISSGHGKGTRAVIKAPMRYESRTKGERSA